MSIFHVIIYNYYICNVSFGSITLHHSLSYVEFVGVKVNGESLYTISCKSPH